MTKCVGMPDVGIGMIMSAIFSYDFRAEYSAFWKCVQAGAAYLFTQLCKMLVLATFFPENEVPIGGFDVVGVSFCDIVRIISCCISCSIYNNTSQKLTALLSLRYDYFVLVYRRKQCD